jgi:hypothetical protein
VRFGRDPSSSHRGDKEEEKVFRDLSQSRDKSLLSSKVNAKATDENGWNGRPGTTGLRYDHQNVIKLKSFTQTRP